MATYCYEDAVGDHIHLEFSMGKAPDVVKASGHQYKRVLPCKVMVLIPSWTGSDAQKEEFHQADILEKELKSPT